MPVLDVTGHAAFEHLRSNIEGLNGRLDVRDTDLLFLKGLMESPVMSSLVKLQDRLEESNGSMKPVSDKNSGLVKDVQQICRRAPNRDAQELAKLLANPHVNAMVTAHDDIAAKTYDPPDPPPDIPSAMIPVSNGLPGDAIRMVGIRKREDDPLGITIHVENGNIYIARVLAGGIVDRQGLLHVGDMILEVNNNAVNTPEQLQTELKKAQGNVTFKVKPTFQDTIPPSQVFYKALFNYEPTEDKLVPCKDIAIPFKNGEILKILNQEDPNWWQAQNMSSGSPKTGLIPSQELEERRRAFVRPEFDYATKITMCGTRVSKKKRKSIYSSKDNAEFDKAELTLYEEVACMPPFERKTIVLVGAQGVGRRSLKSRLISGSGDKYATPLPHTSRPIREYEQDGKNYFFVARAAMEADIAENQYLEWGDHNGHLYGTKLDSIRAIIRSGKMCVLDCNPQCLKILKTSEFMPYVIFIATPPQDELRRMHEYGRVHGYSNRSLTFDRAMGRHSSRRARTLESLVSVYEDEDLKNTIEESGRLQRAYEKYFDCTLLNSNFDKTYELLKETIDNLTKNHQWVPISWVY